MPEGKNLKLIGVQRDRVITMGRSDRSDLIINDQSISQRHALIFYSSLLNKFILQDNESKFGTLKVIQQPLKIEPGVHTYIQIGCTVLQFELEQKDKKTKTCFSRICRSFRKKDT